jgi:hypothetical protein
LGLGQTGETLAGEQLDPKRLVEAFDLAGRGRAADPGAQMGDAVLAADPIEQDLGRVRAEPAGEHLAVVGQHLIWEPVALQSGDKDPIG